jgi:hypothetical protein
MALKDISRRGISVTIDYITQTPCSTGIHDNFARGKPLTLLGEFGKK